jgi:aryl-alcohol dehydrogenase-like predicted oxidoreductase
MKGKQPEKARRAKEGNCDSNHNKWHEMNRKQRREVIRKIQSEEISLAVVHPHAAGIDIGNEAHYAAVPPGRDSQPVRRFGCTTAEVKEMADWLKQCGIRTVDCKDRPVVSLEYCRQEDPGLFGGEHAHLATAEPRQRWPETWYL